MTEITATKILDGAIKLLQDNHWIQGTLAKDYRGYQVDPSNPDACGFCVIGAIDRASHDLGDVELNSFAGMDVRRATNKILCGEFVSVWNDSCCKSKEQAIKFLERAKEFL